MFASAFENTERPYIPVFVDAEGEAPGGWPKGGVTRVNLPNRHLEYAITWFGLAGALAAVFAAYRGAPGCGGHDLGDGSALLPRLSAKDTVGELAFRGHFPCR